MKAPDKIYLSVEKGEDWTYAMWTTKSPEEQKFSELDDHEEYIRKDVLIEWLRKEYKTVSWYDEKMRHVTGCVGDTSASGKAEAYQSVINKLNSM